MLYCSYCDKMVEFNSTAVSSPTAAVTLDLEGDFDPTRIASKTRVLNVCKECGQHGNLYVSREQWRETQEQAQEQENLARGMLVQGVLSIPIGILLSSAFLPVSDMVSFVVYFTVGGGAVGFGLGMMGLFSFIFNNSKNLIWLALFVVLGHSWKWHQRSNASDILEEKVVINVLNLVDTSSTEYTEKGIYEIKENWKNSYTREEVDVLISAANRGSKRAEVALGFYNELQGNFEEAVELYKKAAYQGSPRAMFRLGVIKLEGLGSIPESLVLATQWFRNAAKVGSTEAKSMLLQIE
ncbi:sel1 repeat family protein [Akkermansiaceae bacterium]|nr:sel1 repeat family protein [bacterium]MDB4723987.1 sel1 repeat family protein [Akkermansiaceae bacterium]MDC0320791.1 sel1 repeat family protein [Akkermansiaceae bacterium]